MPWGMLGFVVVLFCSAVASQGGNSVARHWPIVPSIGAVNVGHLAGDQ